MMFSQETSEILRAGSRARAARSDEISDERTRSANGVAGSAFSTAVTHGLLDARVLGWLSLGLGITALLMPRQLGRMTGLKTAPSLLRLVGCRELVSAAGLLSRQRGMPWLWSRVVGDAMDLLLVGSSARKVRANRGRLALTAAVLAAVTAVDVAASVRATAHR